MRGIGDALRVVARGGRDHALGARRLVELEQGIERAAFLIGAVYLGFPKLELNGSSCHSRQALLAYVWTRLFGSGLPNCVPAHSSCVTGGAGEGSGRWTGNIFN